MKDDQKDLNAALTAASECIHCHRCRDSCAFLSKYGIDIGDVDRLRELSYHCFLCGRCTEVCPVHIDGRRTVMDLRREYVASGGKKSIEQSYRGLVREKKDYIYRNWKGAAEGSVFFPGCNFPSMYPKTNAEIVRLFADRGIGTIYECCGKPIAELGLKEDEDRIIDNIRRRLAEHHIEEIVTACPNCRAFFGDRLGIRVTGIFSKLSELGLGNVVSGDYLFYIPCPDRTEKKWIEEIRPFIDGRIDCIEGIECCGLGGSAAFKEPEIAELFTDKLKEQYAAIKKMETGSGNDASATCSIATYCASCTGRFKRTGFDSVEHILPKILGTYEKPDTRKSYINRVLTKFK